METLVRLVYISEATRPFSLAELKALSASAVTRNQTIDVTGILLYSAGTFLQCIEGPPRSILNLYSRIEADRRHTRVMQVSYEVIDKRLFGHWWMGLLNITEEASPEQRRELSMLVRAAREGTKINVVKLLKSFRAALPAPAGV